MPRRNRPAHVRRGAPLRRPDAPTPPASGDQLARSLVDRGLASPDILRDASQRRSPNR